MSVKKSQAPGRIPPPSFHPYRDEEAFHRRIDDATTTPSERAAEELRALARAHPHALTRLCESVAGRDPTALLARASQVERRVTARRVVLHPDVFHVVLAVDSYNADRSEKGPGRVTQLLDERLADAVGNPDAAERIHAAAARYDQREDEQRLVLFSDTVDAEAFDPNDEEWVDREIELWAQLFGFTKDDLKRKLWGVRSERHEPLKQTQTLLAAHLRDQGCTYTTIGKAMGNRTAPAAYVLAQKGYGLRTITATATAIVDDELLELQQVVDTLDAAPEADPEATEAKRYREHQHALRTIAGTRKAE